MPRGRPFQPGQSGNIKGRPKGIIDKRQRMQKALGEGADAVIAVVKSKAIEGDMQAAGLVLARLVPTLKPEGVLIRFALDASLSTSQQFAQVSQAIANGQLTVDEAKQVVEIIKLQAEARAAEGIGENAQTLINAFKEMAGKVPV